MNSSSFISKPVINLDMNAMISSQNLEKLDNKLIGRLDFNASRYDITIR
jgi:hypothetical protein